MSTTATILARGAIGSRPAAGSPGHVYFSTEPKTYRDNGSSWDDVSDSGSGLADQGVATYLDFTTAAAPSSPASGKVRVYSKTGDHLAQKTSGGVETLLDATGGGGSTGARYPVQEKAGTAASQSSLVVTMATAPTNGNLLIAIIESEGGTNVTGITQTNVTWTKVAESTAGTSPHSEIWKGVVAASAGTAATISWSGTTFTGAHISEWSGVTGTLDQSAAYTNVSAQYLPIITPTIQTALVIAGGAQSTFGHGFGQAMSPNLMNFAADTAYAAMFGFPGTNAVYGVFPNSHGGTFSGVTVSLT